MLTLKRTSVNPLPGVILLILTLLVSLCIYQDYGVAYDEFAQRDIGMVSYRYVFEGDNKLLDYKDRDHGVGFDMPLAIIEKAFDITDLRDVYLMRHLVTHFFFLVGVFFGYLLALRLFRNQWLSCLVFLMLLLQPRIYVHSYFNSKDVPFLSVLTIALYLASVAFESRKYKWFLLLGATLGYGTGIRITGILPAAIITSFFFIDLLSARSRGERWYQQLANLACYALGFVVLLYASWPLLWQHPVGSFIESYQRLSHYHWQGFVWFGGQSIDASNLPWKYLPAWFSITMPVGILALGITGMCWILANALRQPLLYATDVHRRNFIFYLLCICGAFLSIILLGSTVYDDWRHIYFVYPCFVMMAAFAVHKLSQTRMRPFVIGACVVQLVSVLYTMVSLHPFQQVYFNSFVSHDDESLRNQWEYEYWGAGYKQALEYLLETETSYEIKIWGLHSIYDIYIYPPLSENRDMLPADQRNRVILTQNRDEAKYYITGFRYHPEDYSEYPDIHHSIKVQNSSVVRIYKLRD